MKLDDIHKKNIFDVPDRYFDQLPGQIQKRITKKENLYTSVVRNGYWPRLAIPALGLVLVLIFFANPGKYQSVESIEVMLAEVSDEDVIAYLQSTDITIEEIMEHVDGEALVLEPADPLTNDLEIENLDLNALMDNYGIDENYL
ncbi:MAG: hypothetical protein HC819_05860 [Cyclobacteriaceae bacterium]|nr:hypothetical protein [Cyclobacteriaceae bacterium]